MTPIIATISLCIACIRLYFCIKQRKLIALAWFLIAYFCFFYIPVSMTGDFRHIQKFTDASVIVTADYIAKVINFVFLFNILFLVSELLLNGILNHRKITWTQIQTSPAMDNLIVVFGIMLVFSSIAYGVATWGFDYRDYVEFQGNNWSVVFFWAASPVIVLAALQKKYLIACIATIPYLYFAIAMNVRSFALLSIVPLAIVYGQQMLSSGSKDAAIMVKKVVLSGIIILVLLIFSSIVMQQKHGRGAGLVLPDSGIPFSSVVVFKLSDSASIRTEWDSLILYSQNVLNPFIRLLDVEIARITDPPVVIARLVEGLPKNWPVYFHYPTLWYSDAYLAFGWSGLWLAVLWALILVSLEWVLARNALLLGLFLPFYSWHVYMLVRGAPAGASVPFSYAAYIGVIAGFVFSGGAMFRPQEPPRVKRRRVPPPAHRSTPLKSRG